MTDRSLPFRLWRTWLGLVVAVPCALATVDAGVVRSAEGGRAEGAQVLHVGSARIITTVADAARIARSGDTVLIDAGDYVGDVATWTQDRLTIRARPGRVRMVADGKAAEGKAIWVINGTDVLVEGIEFTGTRVAHLNGAGIRHQGGNLTVRNCKFYDNENGILTWNNHLAELTIENTEFHHNGAGDGQSHNLYVGEIHRLTITGSYSHHARVGHLLKSRAEQNYVMYNRLTDESAGHASYELEFPSGGLAYVIGNIIEQGPQTENLKMVSFGVEGYRWPRNEVFLVNNTLVDDSRGGGTFFHVAAGAQRVVTFNNLLLGSASFGTKGPGQDVGNVIADRREIVAPTLFDYRLREGSALVGTAKDPGDANGVALRPNREYVHPLQTRPLRGDPYSPGALQRAAP
jgi:Right handed beta helix region